MKFLIYTIAGSAFMLVGILVLAFSANTFDITELLQSDFSGAVLSLHAVFVFLLIGFAVKLPVAPLHTWLPDAHTDAPTAVSVMLAGVLLKMGGYGIIRFCVGLLPEQAADFDIWLAAFAVVSIIYGGLITLRQTDLKRLIAYSSVSHMGFVLLGIAALGETAIGGAVVQMITHGMITGMLFVMVGLLYERTHTRQIAEMRGLGHNLPYVGVMFVFAGVASLGLPALAGFVGEVLVFLGAWERFEWATIIAVFGVLLSAGYILWMLERVFFGPPDEKWAHLDARTRWWEHAPVLGLTALIIVVGVYPALVTDVVDLGVAPMMERL
jgi:NADH-quinone oxidoreductase subunit M